jgi:hypothetical protein
MATPSPCRPALPSMPADRGPVTDHDRGRRPRARLLRRFAADCRGAVDALDVALLGLGLAAIAVALGGPAEALERTGRVVTLFLRWLG